jgi:hypothetical protein
MKENMSKTCKTSGTPSKDQIYKSWVWKKQNIFKVKAQATYSVKYQLKTSPNLRNRGTKRCRRITEHQTFRIRKETPAGI